MKWPLLLIAFTLVSAKAQASACWVDPGSWGTHTLPVSDYQRERLSTLSFDGALTRNIGQADPQLDWERGTVTGAFDDEALVLRFTPDSAAGTATLRFVHDGQVERFYADISSDAASHSAILYTELRFQGRLVGDASELLPFDETATAMLVVQGQTQSICPGNEDLDHWILKFTTREGEILEPAHMYGTLQGAP